MDAGGPRALSLPGGDALSVLSDDMRPLAEGVRRHTISVFVVDESGLINRVAGVFARRGFNIESLAVGLNLDKALFTVVFSCPDRAASALKKQLYKLINVRSVEDLTHTPRVERGLMLIKLAAPASARTEIMQLCEIFHASVVDVSESRMTIAVVGDPGKTSAFQRAVAPYGVLDIARTGKIALKREGGRARAAAAGAGAPGAASGANPGRPSRLPAPGTPESVIPESGILEPGGGGSGDVYRVEPGAARGVWDVPVLDPYFSRGDDDVTGAGADGIEPHVLSVLVADEPGVLDRVTGVIARRGYNVQSLAVGPAEPAGMSRITCVVPGTGPSVAKLINQVLKLVSVLAAEDLSRAPFVERELLLIKVACGAGGRSELADLAAIFRAKVVDVSAETVTLQAVGVEAKVAAFQSLVEPYGILEMARTGIVALARDSGVDTKLLAAVEQASLYGHV